MVNGLPADACKTSGYQQEYAAFVFFHFFFFKLTSNSKIIVSVPLVVEIALLLHLVQHMTWFTNRYKQTIYFFFHVFSTNNRRSDFLIPPFTTLLNFSPLRCCDALPPAYNNGRVVIATGGSAAPLPGLPLAKNMPRVETRMVDEDGVEDMAVDRKVCTWSICPIFKYIVRHTTYDTDVHSSKSIQDTLFLLSFSGWPFFY